MSAEFSRRRFLQFMGAGAGTAMLPGWVGLDAANAAPLIPGQTIVVSLFLGGGLDGAHMLVPTGSSFYGEYAARRGPLAVDPATTLGLAGENSLHGAFPNLHARYQAGDVAFVRGVDLLGSSGFDALSHFDKTDHVMMGRNMPAGPPSGVWARWADGEPDNGLLLSTVGFGLPILYGGGTKRQATSLPTTLQSALGASPTPFEDLLIAALDDVTASYAPSDTGLEAFAAQTTSGAMQLARDLGPVYPTAAVGESELTRNLKVIASLIEANVTGTRVYGTVHGSYDTHENQLTDLDQQLFPDLDASLETFFQALTNPQDVVVMVWTEFGRRPEANATGTDHGTAGNVVLVGPRVNGGLFGAQPSFALPDLDANRNLVGTVAFHQVYAELIDAFLGGDSVGVLGNAYPALGLIS